MWRKYWEAIIWSIALVLLYIWGGSGPSLCPLSWLAPSYCPGCGLGRSLYYFMHADISAAWQHHVMGIPAFFILAYQIFQSILFNKKSPWTNNYS